VKPFSHDPFSPEISLKLCVVFLLTSTTP
jgi:hypothetical protein